MSLEGLRKIMQIIVAKIWEIMSESKINFQSLF